MDAAGASLRFAPAGACTRANLGSGTTTGGRSPSWLRLTAEKTWELGRTEDALAALRTALDMAEGTGSRNFFPELQRLKGESLIQQGGPVEAERCIRRALELAREQEAKSLELRAATSLARLLRDQGRRDEARGILQPIYDWFTEGFDTADLKEANALLQDLS